MRPRTGCARLRNETAAPGSRFSNKEGILPMAVTPSKDYKRREREQRKFDKRMARDTAKSLELEAQQIAAQAAAEEAVKQNAADHQAGLEAAFEAEFEAELEAERKSQKVA